jgi:uncharacterized protein YpmB
MGLVKVICVTEPDISYTRNKKLNVGEQYWGEYQESNLGSYGVARIYDIYNQDKIKQGQYFAIDFQTIEEYRDKKLADLLQ